MRFCPVLLEKDNAGEHILLGTVYKRNEFRHLRLDLVGDTAPLLASSRRRVLKAKAMKAGDDAPSVPRHEPARCA